MFGGKKQPIADVCWGKKKRIKKERGERKKREGNKREKERERKQSQRKRRQHKPAIFIIVAWGTEQKRCSQKKEFLFFAAHSFSCKEVMVKGRQGIKQSDILNY